MALEKYASTNPNTIHTDVLSEARQACYKARDAFYTCLEKESNKKPTEIASVGLLYPVECKESRAQYVSQCRPTWVKHFDRQYCSKKRVQRLLDDNESRRAWFFFGYSSSVRSLKIEVAKIAFEKFPRSLSR
ncbi:uncharacterized protein LOC117924616 isoform X1 [Vitis riparia]|uniref:uncharacterized protein LOC117924616 isoform X1 n=1 Tax=Vitis riparia TaxID=96939 RepID=UPI00155A324D|nr:uncharacterized protein LOC117924616 isoform X1 [Vitis riparia]